MSFRCVVAMALVFALLSPARAQQAAPLSAAGQRIRERVANVSIGGRMTVKTLDGRELHGSLSGIEPESFALREVDLGTTLTLRYDDVQSVERNYGRKGFQGHRVSPRKSLIAGILIAGGLLALVFIALASDKS